MKAVREQNIKVLRNIASRIIDDKQDSLAGQQLRQILGSAYTGSLPDEPNEGHLSESLNGGVWMAYDTDANGGDAVPFGSEVEALRFALDNYMWVRFVPWGEYARRDANKQAKDGDE